MHLPQFEYLAPRTTEELAGLLSEHRDRARILAGGTDLLPSMKDRLVRPEYVIDIGNLATMNGITEHDGSGLVIGAATKLAALEQSPPTTSSNFETGIGNRMATAAATAAAADTTANR